MANHSSVLAWRIPGMGSHRVGHDWSDLAAAVPGIHEGFPWLSGKESTCNVGDPDSIPGSGRSPGGGHGSPLEYPYLENPLDRGAWQATVHRVTKSRTRVNQQSIPAHRQPWSITTVKIINLFVMPQSFLLRSKWIFNFPKSDQLLSKVTLWIKVALVSTAKVSDTFVN